MSREDSVDRVLTTLRLFLTSPQGSESDVTGFKGFYDHFLDRGTDFALKESVRLSAKAQAGVTSII